MRVPRESLGLGCVRISARSSENSRKYGDFAEKGRKNGFSASFRGMKMSFEGEAPREGTYRKTIG